MRFQCPCPHLRWSDQGVSLQSEFGEVAPPTPRLTMENPLAVHVAARLRSPPGACSDPDRPYLAEQGDWTPLRSKRTGQRAKRVDDASASRLWMIVGD